LYLLEFFDFLKGIEFLFHAFDGDVFACFEGECCEDDGEGAATFLILKFVLIHVLSK
jgi:hypothetical protein